MSEVKVFEWESGSRQWRLLLSGGGYYLLKYWDEPTGEWARVPPHWDPMDILCRRLKERGMLREEHEND